MLAEASQVFVLTDENVAMYWLPELKHWLDCDQAVEVVVKAGERHKTLTTAQQVWQAMMDHKADRQSVLVNFGGGMISDLGGFVASTYGRGIRFINVPTTLLAMVDAAIGGKNGVDFAGCKNQIGTFAEPEEVMVSPIYLSTLPERELLSGLAEMLKYGFIADEDLLIVSESNYEQYLLRAGKIKRSIVKDDPFDQGERKVLNFGHTLGHALESYSLTTDHPLTHGEAVALGMWCALWISVRQCGLRETVLLDYDPKLEYLLAESGFGFDETEVDAIMGYLDHDKKNQNGTPSFILLKAVEKPLLDQPVPEEMVRASLVELSHCLAGL